MFMNATSSTRKNLLQSSAEMTSFRRLVSTRPSWCSVSFKLYREEGSRGENLADLAFCKPSAPRIHNLVCNFLDVQGLFKEDRILLRRVFESSAYDRFEFRLIGSPTQIYSVTVEGNSSLAVFNRPLVRAPLKQKKITVLNTFDFVAEQRTSVLSQVNITYGSWLNRQKVREREGDRLLEAFYNSRTVIDLALCNTTCGVTRMMRKLGPFPNL